LLPAKISIPATIATSAITDTAITFVDDLEPVGWALRLCVVAGR